MPAQVTTRAQVSGYRFLLRRLEHALVRRDARMLSDPLGAQSRSIIVGLVLALVVLGGCGALAVIRPYGAVGNAIIIAVRGSGALHVIVDGRLHPAANLTSARLIAGKPDSPTQVAERKLSTYPRGPLVGILGAPNAIAASGTETQRWIVCDTTVAAPADQPGAVDATSTTLIVGGDTRAVTSAHRAAGVFVTDGIGTWVLYQGLRARIDARVPALRSAIGLPEGVTARPVSAALLNAYTETDPVAAPRITGIGLPSAVAGVSTGTVLRVQKTAGVELFVALRSGIQRIGTVAADILRAVAPADLVDVSVAALAAVPSVRELPLGELPSSSLQFADARSAPTVCVAHSRGANVATSGSVVSFVAAAVPLPPSTTPVPLATADGNGPGLDSVFLQPGVGEFIAATGAAADAERVGAMFYVSDTGVRFGIDDVKTAAIVGINRKPLLVPWSVISLLPVGPVLSVAAARTTHDGVALDTAAGVLQVPD